MVELFSSVDSKQLVELLLHWFRETKRDLPWRHTYDPYHVWISEIMLQQTQMDRGVVCFLSWMKRFPTVQHVAEAEEDEILQHWEGLGYYARARNLHRAAKIIAKDFEGQVPADYEILLGLPGIGPYTAAAVASIAGNQDVPVIDANVNRVFARLCNIESPIKESCSQKKIKKIVTQLLPPGKARNFNQALMDFGGLVCTPKAPLCGKCPVSHMCRACQLDLVCERPVLNKPKRAVFIHREAGFIVYGGKIYVQKRARKAVWGGLWEFPGGEIVVEKNGEARFNLEAEIEKETSLVVVRKSFLVRVKHQYTHHRITLDCYQCELSGPVTETMLKSANEYRWIAPLDLDALGFPSGVRKVIDHLKHTKPEMFEENYAR